MEKHIKHRESFVDPRRKSLTFTNIFNAEKEETDVSRSKISIRDYLESLLKEKDDWKEIFKQMKRNCENSEGKLKYEPYTIDKRTAESRITAEDKSFLESRPDYMEMVKSVQRYVDCVHFLNKYKSDVIDYYGKACDEIEIYNKSLIDEMMSDNLCDICNTMSCNKSNHKFKI